MATMRARFRMQCRAPASADGLEEQIAECELVERIPYAPRVGDKLKVTKNGTFYEVGEVCWDVDAPTYLIVYFREPQSMDDGRDFMAQLPWLPHLKLEGWTEL